MGDVVPGPFGVVRQLADNMSDFFARAALSRMLGKTFGGKRDVYGTLGYKQTKEITADDLRERYERGEIAGTICEAWPDATWKDGAQVLEVKDVEEDTEFEKAWVALDKRLKLWSVFRRVDILAQMGEYSTLLIGAPDELDRPLPRLNGEQGILYVQPYGADIMKVEFVEEDSKNPRFGLPKVYRLKRASNRASASMNDKKTVTDRLVHWSRIIHVADGLLDDNVYSAALRLRRVWNRLDDLDKVAGAGSEAFWRRAHQGTVFKVDPKVEMTDPELTKVQEQVDEFEHEVRRVMRLRGVDVQQLGSDVADFSNPVDVLLKLIAAGSRIPKRILEGSERGELASTTDQENFDARVSDRRTQYAEPVIVRQFIDRMLSVGALPTPKDNEYFLMWPGHAKTPTEQAELAKHYADINSKMKLDVVKPNEIRDELNFDPDPNLENLPVDRLNPKPKEPAAVEPEPDPDEEDEKDPDDPDAEEEDEEDEEQP